MAASNALIAETLRKYAAALVVEGADRFKVKAYRRGAETIEALQGDVAAMVGQGADLTELPGTGKALAATIGEIVARGKLGRLERSLANRSPVHGLPRAAPWAFLGRRFAAARMDDTAEPERLVHSKDNMTKLSWIKAA